MKKISNKLSIIIKWDGDNCAVYRANRWYKPKEKFHPVTNVPYDKKSYLDVKVNSGAVSIAYIDEITINKQESP